MSEYSRYSMHQIVLHWLVAVLIAGQFLFNDAIVAAWDAMTRGLPVAFSPLILTHVAGGLLILALVVWRLVLRMRYGAPDLPAGQPPLLKLAARLSHWTLYGLLIALAFSGLAAWFGHIAVAAQVHSVLKTLLLALIVLHVLAVVFHHLVLKDPILKRMTPRLKP